MALILAVEPDERQAAILSGVVMNQLRADLVLVDSRDAALARIRQQVPDLVLLSAGLSRADEEEFVGRARKMKSADHLRTLTIPLLGSTDDREESSGGLLRAFKWRRAEVRPSGRDPKQFAREILHSLKRAEKLKAARRTAADIASAAPPAAQPIAPVAPPALAAKASLDLRAALEPQPAAGSAIVRAVTTLASIEGGVALARRAIDAREPATGGDLDAILGALRLPSRVAGFRYPRGCRIRQIRLARPPRPAPRPGAEPPPVGVAARLEAAF